MSSNVLDPSSILHNILQNLPNSLQSPYDALMAASHSAMLAVGFKFAGLGDDARQEGDGTKTILPNEWNDHGPHVYSIRYSHPQSSLTFIIKSIKLGEKWILHGLGIGDDKTATLELNPADYTSSSFYPYSKDSDQPLVHGFISTSRFNDFLILYKINIIQRLIPGLTKPGYTEEQSTTSTQSAPSSSQPAPSQSPPPIRPPIFDTPTSPDEPYSGIPSVGDDDLNPLGAPVRIPESLRRPGGGMYVGPDHPIFSGRHHDDNDSADIFGGPQPLPRGSVPPGARFDPIGPFGANPTRRGRGAFGRGRGQGRGGQFPGEPDNDELPPPGFNDMFM
ncbi:PI31 proteasome regulator N-terminal-domain-containing protein [Halteromyces radiatus]|uniref:PI31 proteasome regulator N-terminal-domain-containing protein n=1 Tax=Halteromyces radiatus TaxID=101107 RepID=UPI00221EE29E|nr:PI31 proteasome regulator N-terminal-domain-containing protein [Halteromyces radiatus]KAI8098696.1 PI31 proteasome regulator N-terminal-domain-containing protein [Halteromyces radiatus]